MMIAQDDDAPLLAQRGSDATPSLLSIICVDFYGTYLGLKEWVRAYPTLSRAPSRRSCGRSFLRKYLACSYTNSLCF